MVAAGEWLNISLHYTGDLAEIEALGFQTVWNERSGRVTRTVDLANLELIAAHPDILKMSFGQEPDLLLDKSMSDICANQVWTFMPVPG